MKTLHTTAALVATFMLMTATAHAAHRSDYEKEREAKAIVKIAIYAVIATSGVWYYASRKKCQYCKKRISKSATVCKHCGKDL